MFPLRKLFKLLRYLIVWRVNESLVRLPVCPEADISRALATIIAQRLPSGEARAWYKALQSGSKVAAGHGSPLPKDIAPCCWPIDAIIMSHSRKLIYGRDEPFIWELKVFGEAARHDFFLETILPSMEEAGYTNDTSLRSKNALWGRFDVAAVYCAKGRTWEPMVSNGELDLEYSPARDQWADGLQDSIDGPHAYQRLVWCTPFALSSPAEKGLGQGRALSEKGNAPTMPHIMLSLLERLKTLLESRRRPVNDLKEVLPDEGVALLSEVMELAAGTSLLSTQLKDCRGYFSGFRTGTLTFLPIPTKMLPFLELASILHIGRMTHLGCGTFILLR